MTTESKLLHYQWGLLAASLALVLVYWLGYRALSQHAVELDAPLNAAWKKLSAAAPNIDGRQALDVATLTRGLQQAQKSTAILQQAGQLARGRIELEPDLRARLRDSFQLLDYDKSRLQTLADLRKLAEAKKVILEPAVAAGFPEFSTSLNKPALLWVQLAIVNQVVTTAVTQEPRLIKTLTVLPIRSYGPDNGQQAMLEEIPVPIEVFGPRDALVQFLQSLPLRGAEIKELGYREVPVPKQALFVDHFILKNSTNSLHEAHLDLVASGFISRERDMPP